MAGEDGFEVRQEVMQLLLEKVTQDRRPSVTMMNTLEQLLTPQDVQRYAEVLMEKVRKDKHPSYDMIQRLLRLA